MSSNKKPNIDQEDWRLQAIATVKESKGDIFPKGSRLTLITTAKYNDKKVTFAMPSMTALFLNFSNDLGVQSEEILVGEEFLESSKRNQSEVEIFSAENVEKLFEFFENRMSSIVFAHCALESFANEYIPDEYNHQIERQDKKCIESYNKQQIERNLNLDTKLGSVLPSIFEIDTPKGGTIWNRYTLLKNLRDRIIHSKSDDRRPSQPGQNTIWKELLQKDLPNFAVEAKNIIGYYFPDFKEKPRWLQKIPF